MREAVIFIHGIWMTGLELSPLRKRIARRGYDCHQFNYHSVFDSPRNNATALNTYLDSIDADVIHLVAHSLGGIIVLHLFKFYSLQKPGRVLMMGTPVKGSVMAIRLANSVLTRPLLGRSINQGLLGDAPGWNQGRELGMIAGSRGLGMGKLLFSGLERPNDGTVSVAETKADWITNHLTVPYSHFGMLFSTRVAEAVCQFIATGDFA